MPAIRAKAGSIAFVFSVPYHYYSIFPAVGSLETPVQQGFWAIQQQATQLLRLAAKKCALMRLASREFSVSWFCCFSGLCVGPDGCDLANHYRQHWRYSGQWDRSGAIVKITNGL